MSSVDVRPRFELKLLDGSFVWRGVMPPFLQAPQVVLWGSRVFERTSSTGDVLEYREVFAWTCPE